MRKVKGGIEQRLAAAQELSDIALGKTNIGFHKFVLSGLLEEVLAFASKRLTKMTNGRFILERAQRDDKKYSGLDLVVFDVETGKNRPVGTLSGGQTFLASLSLALGLADIVQSRCGGVHLDSMFIDEGFGTLDQQTLELAFKAFIDLQEKGRLVGIISHVAELKNWIDARLEVTSAANGSRAFITVV
jgi:exonuclease SbcC